VDTALRAFKVILIVGGCALLVTVGAGGLVRLGEFFARATVPPEPMAMLLGLAALVGIGVGSAASMAALEGGEL
jgi:hypothetical protein